MRQQAYQAFSLIPFRSWVASRDVLLSGYLVESLPTWKYPAI